MYVTELDSFIKKFQQLWKAGFTAHLDLNAQAGKAWVGIRAELGHAPGPAVHQKVHHPSSSHSSHRGPAYQRRQDRRRQAAQAAAAAEQAAQVEAEHAEKAADTEAREVDIETAEVAEATQHNSDFAEEAVKKVNVTVRDEVCPDEEYSSSLKKMKCTIQLVPLNQSNIEAFRNNVENYFEERKDIIESIHACKIENAGKNVRLEAIVRRQLWMNFFNDPNENYGDLPGVHRVVHDCRDLANCDRIDA